MNENLFVDKTEKQPHKKKTELKKETKLDTELKQLLVDYTGNKLQPENDEVNVEMIISVMAEEFPEFLMPLAEENFIRGYRQGLEDADKKFLQTSDADHAK